MPGGSSRFRLFISSTFQDFEAEREALRLRVFPRLRSLCEAGDATFEAVDLRWGVSRDAANERRTIDICLEEVERCVRSTAKPNFLLLLGDRLGWRPPPATLDSGTFRRLNSALAGTSGAELLHRWYGYSDENAVPSVRLIREPSDAQPGEEGRLVAAIASVAYLLDARPAIEALLAGGATEQEVRRRLELAPVDDDRMLVVMRQIDDLSSTRSAARWRDLGRDGAVDEGASARLDALREDLHGAVGPGVISLDTRLVAGAVGDDYVDVFTEVVYERLAAAIEAELAERADRPPGAREEHLHRAFGHSRATDLAGRREELARIAEWVSRRHGPPLIVHGPSGAGKTSLLAAATTMAGFPARSVVRFIGATGASSEPRGLVSSLLSALVPAVEVPPTFDAAADLLANQLAQWPAHDPVTVVVDALDQVGVDGFERWLGSGLSGSVRLVVSVVDGSDRDRLVTLLDGAESMPLDRLPTSDAAAALDRWLDNACRRLQPRQREGVLDAFSHTGMPLHLRLLFERVRTWPSDHEPVLLASDVEAALTRLFIDLEDEFGKPLVETALTSLAAAREGLSSAELVDVLSTQSGVMEDFATRYADSPPVDSLPAVVWSRFLYALEPYLTERERRGGVTLDFFHRQLSTAVARHWASPGARRDHHRRLAVYFDDQPTWLGSGDGAVPNRRKAVELPYQLTEAAEHSRLEEVFADPDALTALVAGRGPWELAEDLERAAAAAPESMLASLRDAARAAAPMIAADDSLLPSQLLGRLPAEQLGLRNRLSAGPWSRPWLEPLNPSLAKGALRFQLDGHEGTVRSVAVSPDGRWCATAGNSANDGTVRLWSLDTGRNTRTFPDMAQEGWTPLAFDHRGHLLVALGAAVLEIEPRGGRRREFLEAEDRIVCLAASTGVPLVAVGAADGTVIARGEEDSTVTHLGLDLEALVVSRDGRRIAALGSAGVGVIDEGVIVAKLETHVDTGTGWGSTPVAISDDGRSVCFGAILREWTVGDPESRPMFEPGNWEAPRGVLTLTSNGSRALVSPGLDDLRDQAFLPGESHMVAGWDVADQTMGPLMPDPGSMVSAAAVTQDGRTGIVAHYDHSVRVWDLERTETTSTDTAHDNPIAAIVLDGDQALVRDQGNIVTRFDLHTGARYDDVELTDELLAMPGADRSIEPPQVLRNRPSTEMISVPSDIERWIALESAGLGILYHRSNVKGSEAADPADGPGPRSAPFEVWDVDAAGSPRRRRGGRTTEPSAQLVQVAPAAGGTIAVVAAWGSLRSYEMSTLRQVHRFEGHGGPVWCIDVLDEEGILASVSEDATVRVWDLAAASPIAAFRGESPMRAVRAAIVDGVVTVVAGEDSGRVHVLRLRKD